MDFYAFWLNIEIRWGLLTPQKKLHKMDLQVEGWYKHTWYKEYLRLEIENTQLGKNNIQIKMILVYMCTYVAWYIWHLIRYYTSNNKAIKDMLERYFMTFSQFPSSFTYKGFSSELEARLWSFKKFTFYPHISGSAFNLHLSIMSL